MSGEVGKKLVWVPEKRIFNCQRLNAIFKCTYFFPLALNNILEDSCPRICLRARNGSTKNSPRCPTAKTFISNNLHQSIFNSFFLLWNASYMSLTHRYIELIVNRNYHFKKRSKGAHRLIVFSLYVDSTSEWNIMNWGWWNRGEIRNWYGRGHSQRRVVCDHLNYHYHSHINIYPIISYRIIMHCRIFF